MPFGLLVLFCYEREYMCLSGDKNANITLAFDSTSRYQDGLLNINPYFQGMANQISSHALQLNIPNASDFNASCLDLHFIRFTRVCSHVTSINDRNKC